MRTYASLLALCAFYCASGAQAADGVIEINQADVEAAGGFPYVITQPGRYILTGNLTLGDSDRDGVAIEADHVTLDLNGFVIQGAASGEGTGISSHDSDLERFRDDVHVRNGTVRDFEQGVWLGSGSVENVRAWENSGDGISALSGAVRHCFVWQSGDDGIVGAIVTDNISLVNGDAGIRLTGSIARRNVLVGNVQNGIVVEAGSSAVLVAENTISQGPDDPALVAEQPDLAEVSYSRNNIRGIAGGLAGDCNVINGVLQCPPTL